MSQSPGDIDPRRAMWRRGSYEIVGDWFRDASISVIDHLEKASGTVVGGAWLDVATGTGAVAIEAARRGATVTGVDLTDELLDIARARADRAGVDITLVLDDFDSFLGSSDPQQYDAVTSSFGVIFAPDPVATAAGLARVLRPGGWLGLTVWAPRSVFIVPDSIGSLLSDPMPGPDMTRWADGVEALFAGTHLEMVDQHTWTQDISFSSPSHAASEIERWSGGWAQLLEHLDSLALGQVARGALEEHLASFGSEESTSFVLHADYVVTVLHRPTAVESGPAREVGSMANVPINGRGRP